MKANKQTIQTAKEHLQLAYNSLMFTDNWEELLKDIDAIYQKLNKMEREL